MAEVLTRRVALRGAPLACMKARDDEVLLVGAAGTGKSYGALMKVHLMCLKNPGMAALMVRKVAVTLTQTGLVTFRDQVAHDAIANGLMSWFGGSKEKPAGYRYANGSFIAVGGLDQPGKIMSSEYDLIYVQEATDLTVTDWELCTSRLRNGKVSFQQMLADCNPQAPSHWLHKRCQEGKTRLLTSVHEDNPRLFDQDPVTGEYTVTDFGRVYINRLDNLTGVRKLRLRYGQWAAAEGIIYDGWRPEVHVIDRRLPDHWRRIWGVDFGYTNPFVWQQWAIDTDGRMILEKEIYRAQTLVADHAAEIKKQAPGIRPHAIVCDHDAEDRATLERELGMGTVAAWKGVSDGIQNLQARLKVQPDGQPRLYVCRNALTSMDNDLAERGLPLGFVQEIEGYVWKRGAQTTATSQEKPVPDEPLKSNDHSMDTARYVGAYLDLAPRGRIRWM